MRIEQQQVKDFMVKAQQETPDRPTMPSVALRKFRVEMIADELLELAQAFGLELRIVTAEEGGAKIVIKDIRQAVEFGEAERLEDLVEAYDAVLDIMVFTIGTAVALGIDLHPGWCEVILSNLSKFIDGHKRADGKWMKGPSFRPPNLKSIIEAQLAYHPVSVPIPVVDASGAQAE